MGIVVAGMGPDLRRYPAHRVESRKIFGRIVTKDYLMQARPDDLSTYPAMPGIHRLRIAE
jgi:hypothetical protein